MQSSNVVIVLRIVTLVGVICIRLYKKVNGYGVFLFLLSLDVKLIKGILVSF